MTPQETYKKAPPGAGFPVKDRGSCVKLPKMWAGPAGPPAAMNCHFRGGGGDAVKHGDMNSILAKPAKSCDVHMGVKEGGLDFKCQACHKTRNHMISGRSISVPAVEGDLSCEYCHTDKPHIESELIDHHLNKHTDMWPARPATFPSIPSAIRPKFSGIGRLPGRIARNRKTNTESPPIIRRKEAFNGKRRPSQPTPGTTGPLSAISLAIGSMKTG